MFYIPLQPHFCVEYELQGFLGIRLFFLPQKAKSSKVGKRLFNLDLLSEHPPSEIGAFLIISEGVKSNREIRKLSQKVGEGC